MRSRSRLLLGSLVLLVAACAPFARQPLDGVSASAPRPSPELRDLRNRLDVHYHLNMPAIVSSRIVSADGSQWTIHQDAARPTPGDYVLQFDGTVAGPGPNERRVLSDGDYQVVLDAQAGSQHQQAQVPLFIREADANPPHITALTVFPDRITPNFDALDDLARVTYSLDKDARVAPYLDAVTPAGQLTRVWMGEEVSVPAGEQSLTWDGLANGQPVTTGSYVLGIRARDLAGSVVETSKPLSVEGSGVPDASIVSAQVGPLQITRGGEVCLDALVRNSGRTVLRTQGPDPSYVYNSLDTFASIQNHAFAEHVGFWRVGLSSSNTTDLTGAAYAYRWGFGRDLQPGEEATVHGCVDVLNDRTELVFFAGLVQENVAIHSAGAGLVRVSISS